MGGICRIERESGGRPALCVATQQKWAPRLRKCFSAFAHLGTAEAACEISTESVENFILVIIKAGSLDLVHQANENIVRYGSALWAIIDYRVKHLGKLGEKPFRISQERKDTLDRVQNEPTRRPARPTGRSKVRRKQRRGATLQWRDDARQWGELGSSREPEKSPHTKGEQRNF